MDLTVKVKNIRQEAVEVKSFELISADGAPLPSFAAGSHIDVHIAPGLIRQYSLCNCPYDNDHYLIAVKKEPKSRGGSASMHERVKQGDTLKIGRPRNNFALVPQAKYHLLLAGGIGVTPLLSMAHYLNAVGAAFELKYFSRSIPHTPFHELLSTASFTGNVGFHYALEPEAVRAYLRKLLWEHPPGAHLYICGPKVFMDLVEQTAAPTWAPDAVHLEYFTVDPSSLLGPRKTFVVKLARTGGECVIQAHQTIVQALAANGIDIDTSCRQGVCGTCLTGVLAGEPDHRDVFLTDDEKQACDKILPCVSRSKTEVLVLDL